jgi:putative membrane protein
MSPGLLVPVALAAGAYALGARRAPRWPWPRAAAFAAGLGALLVALGTGLDARADASLVDHMTQHGLLAFVAPPLLLAGRPLTLMLRSLRGPSRRRLGGLLRGPLGRVLGRPLAGVALFGAVTILTHLPAVYDLALRDETVHALEHGAIFWSAMALWAPLMAIEPLPHRATAIGRLAGMFGGMLPMAAVGATLATAGGVAYPTYARAEGAVAALSDQRDAGYLMWIGGGLFMGAAAVGLAATAMLEEERRQRRREAYEDARRAAEAAR